MSHVTATDGRVKENVKTALSCPPTEGEVFSEAVDGFKPIRELRCDLEQDISRDQNAPETDTATFDCVGRERKV
jgi:hypothetical protein